MHYCIVIGLVLIASGDHENARTQLETAAEVLESVLYEQRSPEAKSALFDLQTTCYHTLQKTLVAMNRNEEALVAAERCKSRYRFPNSSTSTSRKPLPCSENIFDIVNRAKTNILYFSLAEDELYTWFLQPQKRIVRFNVSKIDESTLVIPGKTTSNGKVSSFKDESLSLLEQYINMVRDSLGVNSETVLHEGDGSGWRSSENLLEDFANERQGFMRMVSRNHLLNSSNYSLSSLFSLGSVGGSVASLQGSTRCGFVICFELSEITRLLSCLDLSAVCRDPHVQDVFLRLPHGRDQVPCMLSITCCWRLLMIFYQQA